MAVTGDAMHREVDNAPSAAGRIVVGIDGSISSLEALEWAACQAERTHCALEVVMTWEWPFAHARTPMAHEPDPIRGFEETFKATVGDLLRRHPDVKVIERFEHQHPAKGLIDASRGADLLVVGSRGHGEFAGLLLGSVSQRCAAKALCPVLIHRPAH